MIEIERKSFPNILEGVLGPIIGGWSTDPNGIAIPGLQAVAFGGIEGTPPTICTLGISDSAISSGSGRPSRLEFISPSGCEEGMVAAMVFDLCQTLFDTKLKALSGNYIPLASRYPGNWFAIYLAPAIFLNESDRVFRLNGEDVTLVWAIPIKKEEAAFIDNNGRPAWDEILEAFFDQLDDFKRAPFVL